MKSIISSERNKSLFVPAGLSVIGRPAGSWVAMRTESIDRTGLFIITKDYVKPRAIFDVLVWLSKHQDPIGATVTASFVERTWDGYGVWAQISSISTQDREIWEYFYENAALRCTRGYSESVRVAQILDPQRIVVLEGALPTTLLASLRRLGTTVDLARSPDQAYALARGGTVDIVVLNMADSQYDATALCQRLATLPNPPQSLAMIGSGNREDFEAALYAGAAKVIARPCSTPMLMTRVLEMLQAVKQSRGSRDARPPSGAGEFGAVNQSLWKRLPRRVASLFSGAPAGRPL